MTIIVLPDAQQDLFALQDYMLDKWGESTWEQAENEIFGKLHLIETGILDGTPIPELAAVGLTNYRIITTSNHKFLYQRLGETIYLYLAANHRQDYPTLLMNRLLRK